MSISAPQLLADHASATNTVTSETTPAIGVTVAAGSTIIAFVGGSGPTVGKSLTDSQGNNYSQVATASGPISNIFAFVCTVTTPLGATDTLTAHSASNCSLQIIANS